MSDGQFKGMYLPLQYASRGKRDPQSGLPFFVDNIGDDLLILLLAVVPFSGAPLAVSLAVVALHFSLWSVYEIGYYENDVVAARLERTGQIPVGFKTFENSYSPVLSWAWAIAFGLIGVLVLHWSGASLAGWDGVWKFAALSAIWGIFLFALRRFFKFYNYINKMVRAYAYLPLQLFKYGFPALFFTVPPTGIALLFAQMMRRWIPYLLYRYLGKEKDGFPSRLTRLLIFLVLWLLLLPANQDWQFCLHGLVAAAWLSLRARSQIRELLSGARHISQDDWQKK